MTDHTNAYANVLKGWQVKQLGPKPSEADFATVHLLGLRPGKQALANAMALRADGVSAAQIVMATGAPQLNRMRGLIAAGVVKRPMVPANEQGHTVYKITLTPKGESVVKRATEAAEKAVVDGGAVKPVKAKGKAKADKPKRAPKPAKVTSEAVTVTEPVAIEPATLPATDTAIEQAQA